jgi:hypothetical protein
MVKWDFATLIHDMNRLDKFSGTGTLAASMMPLVDLPIWKRFASGFSSLLDVLDAIQLSIEQAYSQVNPVQRLSSSCVTDSTLDFFF